MPAMERPKPPTLPSGTRSPHRSGRTAFPLRVLSPAGGSPPSRWAALLATVLLVAPALAQDTERSAADPGAQLEAVIASLEVREEVVRALRDDAADEYRRAVAERDRARARVLEAELALDRLVVADDPQPEAIAPALSQLEQAEGDLVEARRRVDRALTQIMTLRAEEREIADKLRALQADLPADAGLLNGTWDVSVLPGNLTGQFFLQQRGTLVTGQYRLSGGWTGSLQGTFVDGSLYLERIDSQRGRDAEYRATLAEGGQRLRGTWQAFELAEGVAPHGSWNAVKRR